MKRRRVQQDASTSSKTRASACPDTPVRRDLLQYYYHSVTNLRQYLLESLPSRSRLRRKKIASIGVNNRTWTEAEGLVAHLLDTTLVCSSRSSDQREEVSKVRWQQWLNFSQQGDESHVTISGDPSASIYSQSEIVDFVIWTLFEKCKPSNAWPKHLLCDGYRRAIAQHEQAVGSIPGLANHYPNSQVKVLKGAPWPSILALLGRSGERLMIDMLLDCSVFIAVEAGLGNYLQLSGPPLTDADPAHIVPHVPEPRNSGERRPSDIVLVRSRMFYARPALTAAGSVQAGLKHIHVLNRCSYTPLRLLPSSEGPSDTNELHARKVLMYMFPRQFGLHNVFTSKVDRKRTAQSFQDYTLREEEITIQFTKHRGQEEHCHELPKIPKRLRCVRDLVRQLQIRHGRCSYFELLHHYCPTILDKGKRKDIGTQQNSNPRSALRKGRAPGYMPSQAQNNKARKFQSQRAHSELQYNSIEDLACPTSHVSAFCQAVISKIVPDSFWGEGAAMQHNKNAVLRKVHHFVKLRRFETMSLHEIAQDLKVTEVPWLRPPKLQGNKVSQTDMDKRRQILHEFLYYVFDSLLIPLIRSNFYVTETNASSQQIFYFRHDVWKRIAEPAMAALKDRMFEELSATNAASTLDSRQLSYSNVRLLPKGKGMRPITNLRKRTPLRKNPKILAPSINFILAPVANSLKLEKRIHSPKLGATMFSISDMYIKLKQFKSELGPGQHHLYFAKVDVQAAFDTIPQDAVLGLMDTIPSQKLYTISKHAEMKPGDRSVAEAANAATRPTRRWQTTALSKTDELDFLGRVEAQEGLRKRNTVFIDNTVIKTHTADSLISLMREHVSQNLVKVGKKFYRQKVGIPQGSVLSSFLCNYFYADLEMRHLTFLQGSDSLLLRLIDDFLLITLDKGKAERFVEVMHGGLSEYGVQVNPCKTLVNFDLEGPNGKVRRLSHSLGFPYCGTRINCRDLEIEKDYERHKNAAQTLTVDYGRSPGQNFQRKVLNAFKIQSHLMYFDTSHNSNSTVLKSLYGAFQETAVKMWAYIRCLPKPKQPRSSLVIRTIIKVIDVAFFLLTSKSRKMRYETYSCDVRKSQVSDAACHAFRDVLSRKRTRYEGVLSWLDKQTGAG